jgi:hypothetical protein
LIRDRDAIFGKWVGTTIQGMGTEAVITAPRSPWQNPFVERLIGSIRRECLDHVIVWNEGSLRRILQSYFKYYERSRTHLALRKDAPVPRPVQIPANGRIVELAEVGGLHHRYQRCAQQTFGNVLLPMFALFADTPGQYDSLLSNAGVFRIMNSITWIYFINLPDQKCQLP